jgi:hypothetical protein
VVLAVVVGTHHRLGRGYCRLSTYCIHGSLQGQGQVHKQFMSASV